MQFCDKYCYIQRLYPVVKMLTSLFRLIEVLVLKLIKGNKKIRALYGVKIICKICGQIIICFEGNLLL